MMPRNPKPTALIGGPDEGAGQIVQTPDGVLHRADDQGAWVPPLALPEALGMDDPELGTSPHGNPYVSPTPPARGLLARAALAAGLAPAPEPSPAQEALQAGPASALGPVAFGRRLQLLDPLVVERGGWAAVDQATGERWTVYRVTSADQAGMMVAAGILYRSVGVAAPPVRLAGMIGGRPVVAWPAFSGWVELGKQSGSRSPELAAELPADVWLANSRIPAGILTRRFLLPDTQPLLRWDLTGVLHYRANGRADGEFGPGAAATLIGAYSSSPDFALAVQEPARMLPMVERLEAVTENQIKMALWKGDIEEERTALLTSALLARRSLVAIEVRRMIADRPPRAR